jgi:hypothetical protein
MPALILAQSPPFASLPDCFDRACTLSTSLTRAERELAEGPYRPYASLLELICLTRGSSTVKL